jgi:hypothetical protein
MIDVIEIIDKNYVSETNPKILTVGVIKDVVDSSYPFSQYIEKKSLKI